MTRLGPRGGGGSAECRLDVAEAIASEHPERVLETVGEAVDLGREKGAVVIHRRAEELQVRLGG